MVHFATKPLHFTSLHSTPPSLFPIPFSIHLQLGAPIAMLSSSCAMADLVLKNALIFTSDDSLPFADSMAILDGRILRLGTYSAVQDLVGSGTKELNLGGKVVVPGFIDAHGHLIYQGLQMKQVNLHGVNHKHEFVTRIAEAAKNTKKGNWVLGGGWNNDLWGGDLPMASWIDDVTPSNPVLLSRIDGHMSLANNVTLKLAGISNLTEDPEGGTIVKTTGGDPTGLLIDSARKLVLPFIPKVSVEERREALLRASNLALARGVTTIVDFGRYYPGESVELSWEDFSDVYQWADSSGKMMIRVCLFFPMETWSSLHDLIHKMGQVLSPWIYLGGVKGFADGSLGSHTALFHEPYVDEPDNCGMQITEREKLFNLTMESDKSKLQVAIHAIGDKANDMVLDIYESVISTNGPRDRRFRVEHAQHLAPGAPQRFGKLGIIASAQPEHLLDDAESATNKLGAQRAEKESFLFRSLLTCKASLAFGSDCPVANINPLGGIRTAMRRIPPSWDHAWMPSECLALDEAIKAYTISAAYASFLDKDLGSLSPGKLADFVILSTDSWDEFEAEGSASIEATYTGGIQAYP
ncbi:protein LONG AFTER FAR-RED 3 isoform X1 [Cucumis melo]|uniref:Protein LONG AFTER FAR-RED 3 isoform X1 n=2 Tax=Cucumis melo TaxID=3656 RepID=A0A1S3BGA6_CUCME|nr:protein LONG AFTER FAR-RED 3 isoform X1 [Cucumis melo]